MAASSEASHKETNRSRWTSMALEVLDLLSFGIEASRERLLNPLVRFVRLSVKFGRSILYPTYSREKKFKTACSNVSQKAKYSLHMSRLSFFDSFDSVDGVPTYSLGPPSDSALKDGPSSSSASSIITALEKQSSSSPRQKNPFSGWMNGGEPFIVVCAFSDDGDRFAIGYSSGVVLVWDTNHGEEVTRYIELSGAQIIALSFRESSHTIVQIVTRDCQCVGWDLLKMTSQKVDISTCWKHLKHPEEQAKLQTADFCHNGGLVVISSILGFGSTSKMVFVVGEVSLFPVFRHITKLSATVKRNVVVSGVEISPDKKGLIVGVSDNAMETGRCFLWPSYRDHRKICRILSRGTLGSWSSNSDLVVTWTIPDGPKPEDNDGSCAFLWNVNEMRKDLSTKDLDCAPTVLKSPFGENVLWCRLVLDLEGKDRLIMALIDTTTRFLFWDVCTKTHTHTIETGTSTKDMPLASNKAWIEARVDKKSMTGLSPMAITSDRSKLGAILDSPSHLLIWDAARGVQSLKITLQQTQANVFKGGADILFSPTNGKIAIVGKQCAMVFAPATASRYSRSNECIKETPMIELDSPNTYNLEGEDYKLHFSGDGKTLGLLSIGCCFMQVYHLAEDTTCRIRLDSRIQDEILDFSFSMDGRYLVTNTSKMVIYLWRCISEEGVLVARVRERVVTMALGITPDTTEIIACSSEGDLIWYNSSQSDGCTSKDAQASENSTSPGTSKSEHVIGTKREFNSGSRAPLLQTGQGYARSHTMHTTRSADHWETSLVYESSYRMDSHEVIGCRISTDCERAVRVLQSGQLEVWNLKERRLEESVPFAISRNVTLVSQDLIPLSGVPIPWENIRSRHHSHDELDKLGLDQEKTILPERESFIVTNSLNISFEALLQRASANLPIPLVEDSSNDSSSIYIVNLNSPEHSRQLKGRNLQPQKGLAVSADGRRVACLSGKFASKIIVWSAYASQDLMPDYHSLSLLYDIKNKTVVKRETQRLLQSFGSNFFTFQHPSGLSVPLDAIGFLNRPLLCTVLDFAYKNSIKVSFLLDNQIQNRSLLCGYHNAVEASLARKSPEIVEIVMASLLKGVTHEAELDSILSHSLIDVHIGYSHIFERIISSPDLFVNICELEIPAKKFRSTEFLTMKSPCLNLTEFNMKKCWHSESPGVRQSDSVALTASAIALPYKDACQFGEDGLLRHLLLNRAHHSVFGSFSLETIIEFKWRCYAKDYVIQELSYHCLIAVTFTVYCFLLREEETYQIAPPDGACAQSPETDHGCGDEENSTEVMATLFLCWLFTIPCLIREVNQCLTYCTQHGLAGFMHWLKSAWNWMEAFSFFNIVVVLPFGHLWFAKEGRDAITLSSLVAVEALILWSRMLFYARPFRPTGPFVIVISSLATAIMPFLTLAFCVTFGFALAFHVLYRHVREAGTHDSGDESVYVSMHNSFDTFGSVLYTIFGYLFGEYNADDVHYGPDENTAMILFVLYMVIMSVILMNMLIAVMGEKYEGIQHYRQMRFFEARAFAIDDVDSMLSRRRKKSLRHKIGGYLHVVSPSFILDRINRSSRHVGHEMDAFTATQRESVYSQLERVLDILRDRLVQEGQTIEQPFRRGSVQQMTPRERVIEGGQVLEIPQNEDVFSLSDRSVLQDPFLDSGLSHK